MTHKTAQNRTHLPESPRRLTAAGTPSTSMTARATSPPETDGNHDTLKYTWDAAGNLVKKPEQK
ncbi:MAG TPA: hypothetical protein VG815_10445 [Chloroflexota bacterium]|nr:hypothetical protein [Chloroflexota bacterium]